ncbi:uncharacterized protein Dyak_GE28782 [Drosophila yakuba]|uniref:Uncharacterized protein n=1 Tax=Drosophila yakuba TaxID=7245 RepID=A0A0R1E912_DROYA|nr:uncharacterized protein Dyak_GE28782 [Drosophila yakuba]
MQTKRKHSVNYSYFISEQHRNAGEGDTVRCDSKRQRRVPSKIYKNQSKHCERKKTSFLQADTDITLYLITYMFA